MSLMCVLNKYKNNNVNSRHLKYHKNIIICFIQISNKSVLFFFYNTCFTNIVKLPTGYWIFVKYALILPIQDAVLKMMPIIHFFY